jgi:hypothetical protein
VVASGARVVERGQPYLSFFEAEFNNFAVRCPIGELDSSKVSYERWLSEKYHDLGREIQSLDPPGDAPSPSGDGEGSLNCRLDRARRWGSRGLESHWAPSIKYVPRDIIKLFHHCQTSIGGRFLLITRWGTLIIGHPYLSFGSREALGRWGSRGSKSHWAPSM